MPSCECGSPRPKYCFCATCARLREKQIEIKGVQGFEFGVDRPEESFAKEVMAEIIKIHSIPNEWFEDYTEWWERRRK